MGIGSSKESKVAGGYSVSVASPPPNGGGAAFRMIPDQFRSFDELSAAMRAVGFENCDVVLAVDFTGSNREQGKKTFGGKDLHHPHEEIIRDAKERQRPKQLLSPPPALPPPPPYV